ncbi:hypothetical protein K3495_g2239 [Podosphaera aphanis]|nr:hypothetical protein K3495_g2239 [Podosphaera aphanis]
MIMDSQQARYVVLTGNTSSSIKDVRAFRSLIQEAQLAVQVKWVPGHSRTERNEDADAAARAALRGLPDRDVEPKAIILAYFHCLLNQKRQALLDIFWDESCPPRYRKLDLQMRRRKPPELALPRRLLLELIAARTGHGNFAAHLGRFSNFGVIMECPCGEEIIPTHFIHCRRHAHHVRHLRGATPYHKFIKYLLGLNCLEIFKTLTDTIGCFESQPATLSMALSVEQEEIVT